MAGLNAVLEVVAPGALATLQDLGRSGWRRLGVPRCGALDPALLAIANVLAGNPAGAAAIEFFVAGPTLKAVDADLQLGLAGDFSAELLRASGEPRRIDAWRSVTLRPGDTLRALAPRSARAGYVAVGGLAVAPVLGSASTYTRARFGGHQGRALTAGDRLPAAASSRSERQLRRPPPRAGGPIRVVPGPQDDHFTPAARTAFFGAAYQVSADADRMGVRLAGPALAHASAQAAEIVSDATVPGSIQVPGNGQPIVLLADGQTVGGYPKIATVVSADLARLATAPVGSLLRFAPVGVAEAEALAREAHAALARLLAAVEAAVADGDIDLHAIAHANLVSGMIDAFDPPPP